MVKWLALALLLVGVWFGWQWANDAYWAVPVGAVKTVEIPEGADGKAVAKILEDQDIIESAGRYLMYGRFDSSVSRARAGSYQIRPGSNFREIARTLALGPARTEVQITIIEGETVDALVDQMEADHKIDPADTVRVIGRSLDRVPFDLALRDTYPFLANLPRDRSLDGYLFPNTYRVWADQLPEGLIGKQLDEFSKRFSAAKPGANSAPLKDLDDVIILASIVQDEVRSNDDMRIVAGIFLNRLRDGMALQSDATLNYLTGSGRARANTRDLSIDSPWNTYKYRGLPPSPIGNPGEAAIKAVLDPEPSQFRYFLTDKEGKTYYARTLEEHVANRQKAGYTQ
ncbi:endolytic transglycosylase MltG [Candidatus Uhrbacteria bacterium]|nr:endolytic transglycosylase MltG [Candidatus Uhrbacteria bacterium]